MAIEEASDHRAECHAAVQSYEVGIVGKASSRVVHHSHCRGLGFGADDAESSGHAYGCSYQAEVVSCKVKQQHGYDRAGRADCQKAAVRHFVEIIAESHAHADQCDGYYARFHYAEFPFPFRFVLRRSLRFRNRPRNDTESYGYQIGYPYYSPISRPLPPRLPVKPASIGMIIVWHAMKQKHVASTNIAFLEKIPFPEIFSFPDKISFSMSEFSYAPRN